MRSPTTHPNKEQLLALTRDDDSSRAARHVQRCTACDRYRAALIEAATRRDAASSPEPDASDGPAVDALAATLTALEPPLVAPAPRLRSRWLRRIAGLLAVFIVMLLVAASWYVTEQREGSDQRGDAATSAASTRAEPQWSV